MAELEGAVGKAKSTSDPEFHHFHGWATQRRQAVCRLNTVWTTQGRDGRRGCIGHSQWSEQAGSGHGKGGELLCLHGACRRRGNVQRAGC